MADASRADLFVSYSRRDNVQGRIAQLVDHIAGEYERAAGRAPRCFFDTNDIRGMDDWRERILDAIREARLLLVFLSPAYFASDYCGWELNEYLKHESARTLLGGGIAPIYIAAVDWERLEAEPNAADRVRAIRRPQRFDMRSWFEHGAALTDEPIQATVTELVEQVRDRLGRLRRSLDVPGNVDKHNERFVGRREELRRLRDLMRRQGVVTAVHGLGGIGKSALVTEYAFAYAHEYGGGRWLVRCEAIDDLRTALGRLASPLAVELSDAENRDADAAFQRIIAELEARARQGTPQRCLLVLDNVDQARLLEPAQVMRLPAADWLDVVVTTRLGNDDLYAREPDRAFLEIDELPQDDAVRLIEAYQDGGRFDGDRERAAAAKTVELLGGFTLAVESAAVFLGTQPRVSCVDLLHRLRQQGLEGLEDIGAERLQSGRHGEMRLTATLRPTLDRLTDAERLAVECAAVLPPDQISLDWIEEIVSEEHEEFQYAVPPGERDPWQSLVYHLLSLRLLRETDALATVRMHRLLQDVVWKESRQGLKHLRARFIDHATRLSSHLKEHWADPEERVELEPLLGFANHLLDDGGLGGAKLGTEIGEVLRDLARYKEGERLLRRSARVGEKWRGPNHEDVLRTLTALGNLLVETAKLEEAEQLLRRVVMTLNLSSNPEGAGGAPYNNLGLLLKVTNRLGEAEPLMRRTVAILNRFARHTGHQHPYFLAIMANYAALLAAMGLDEAEVQRRQDAARAETESAL